MVHRRNKTPSSIVNKTALNSKHLIPINGKLTVHHKFHIIIPQNNSINNNNFWPPLRFLCVFFFTFRIQCNTQQIHQENECNLLSTADTNIVWRPNPDLFIEKAKIYQQNFCICVGLFDKILLIIHLLRLPVFLFLQICSLSIVLWCGV